jgi:hypothetical protein
VKPPRRNDLRTLDHRNDADVIWIIRSNVRVISF